MYVYVDFTVADGILLEPMMLKQRLVVHLEQ